MRTQDKLALMLLGPKNAKHWAEERDERKRGVASTTREEMLEDAKGRPLKVRLPANKSKR